MESGRCKDKGHGRGIEEGKGVEVVMHTSEFPMMSICHRNNGD